MKKWFVLAVIVAMVSSVCSAAEKGKGGGGGMAAMDANKDGKVTKDEFVAGMKARAEKSGKEFDATKAETAFAKADKNSDGVLSGDELTPPAKGGKGGEKKDKPKKSEAGEGGGGEE